ncbi:MAG TPA: hypothetical protein ENH29_08995 [Bacteroidetes bacterium]|nr:hypothetical protein [Bacteroidota bacterium]
MPYPQIDMRQLKVYPLASRKSKSRIEGIAVNPDADPPAAPEIEGVVDEIARRILAARARGAAVILAYGAHLVKNGAGPILIKLMENGWLTHLATQGAGGIHDWEFSYLGRSEEDVRANVATGSFGAWEETGKYINLAVQAGAIDGMGYGESLGALIENEALVLPDPAQLEKEIEEALKSTNEFLPAKIELLKTIRKFNLPAGVVKIPHPYKKYSVFGNAFRNRVPLTVHPGIGYDIIYNNPYTNGAALGRGAHIDYKIFVHSVSNLSHGVFLSIGSAIMAPQIFEKALSFANNIKLQHGEKITGYYILINDLQKSVWNWEKGEPPKSSPDYYLRFLKSFYRMGGTVRYLAADNRKLLHNLYRRLKKLS